MDLYYTKIHKIIKKHFFMKFILHHADVYRRPEKYCQTLYCHFLGLNVSGLLYSRMTYGPEHIPVSNEERPKNPTLSLSPAGSRKDFCYGSKRENWVIQCSIPSLSYRAGDAFTTLLEDDRKFILPLSREITHEKMPELRKIFSEIRTLFQSQLPENIFRAELLSAALLSELMAERPVSPLPDTAERLKEKIDADRTFQKDLAGLCLEIGYSTGHARKCFVERYQVEPGEYRTRLRLQLIMDKLAHTNLTLKEIADTVGMKHVTHLHIFLKNRCSMTPKQLLRQFRGS